jgi:hypothetical protein
MCSRPCTGFVKGDNRFVDQTGFEAIKKGVCKGADFDGSSCEVSI